ncbi:MAG: hypothetical protein ABSH12_08430, partial [Endomicrobiales bacterium]
MHIKKLITLSTLGAFIYSSILYQPLLGMMSLFPTDSTVSTGASSLDKTIFPYDIGRVVTNANYGGDCLFVYIQDLHCNPEVQKNICRTIRFFDAQSHLSNIFVEGAPEGPVSTGLLSSLPDKKIRSQVLDDLLGKGVLSGAEYYAATENKDILYGLEKMDMYRANAERLKLILANKEEFVQAAQEVNQTIRNLKKKFLSNEIRALERILTTLGKGKDDTYYLRLGRLSRELEIDTAQYPNLDTYMRIVRLHAYMDDRSLSTELRSYTRTLETMLPFSVYTHLLQKAQSTDQMNTYYQALADIARVYTPNMDNFPLLKKFFEYIRLNSNINPLNLYYEEKALVSEILMRNSATPVDKDLLFLSQMGSFLEDFATVRITPRALDYFLANENKFKVLLMKYTDDNRTRDAMALLDDDTVHQFYTVNIERNSIFNSVMNPFMTVPQPSSLIQPARKSNVMETLGSFKNVYVVVTGGFHSDIINEFEKKHVSFISVMPNATGQHTETLYDSLMTQKLNIGYFLRSHFAPLLMDVDMDEGTRGIIINSWVERALGAGLTPEVVKDSISKWMSKNKVADIAYDISTTPYKDTYIVTS